MQKFQMIKVFHKINNYLQNDVTQVRLTFVH